MNVWLFFVKHNSLWVCLQNINPFAKVKPMSRAHVVELLAIGNFIGCVMCPGAHVQFQFWYAPHLAILFHLSGMPTILATLLPQLLFPAPLWIPSAHHLPMLALAAYLTFVLRPTYQENLKVKNE